MRLLRCAIDETRMHYLSVQDRPCAKHVMPTLQADANSPKLPCRRPGLQISLHPMLWPRHRGWRKCSGQASLAATWGNEWTTTLMDHTPSPHRLNYQDTGIPANASAAAPFTETECHAQAWICTLDVSLAFCSGMAEEILANLPRVLQSDTEIGCSLVLTSKHKHAAQPDKRAWV